MASESVWRPWFERWPKDIPRNGVLVNTLNEQFPFVGFLTSPDLLLLERRSPDTLGSRKIMLRYEDIATVKFVDVIKAKPFQGQGFVGELTH
jgi:hypothetical protein